MRTRILFLLILMASTTALADDRFQCTPPLSLDERRQSRDFWRGHAFLDSQPMPLPRDEDDEEADVAPRRRFWIFGRRRPLSTAAATSTTPITANHTVFPFSAIGRLSFRDAAGTKRWCTAALVDDGKTVITAAHCIRDRTGTAHTKVIFVRGFKDGNGEVFAVTRMANPREWVTATARQFDYAVLEIDDTASIFLPIRKDDPSGALTAVGYPDGFGSGQTMKRDAGTAGAVNTTKNTAKMLDMEMDHGSSGGTWLADLGTGRVVGITAAKKSDTVALSPRISKNVIDLIDYVQNGCP